MQPGGGECTMGGRKVEVGKTGRETSQYHGGFWYREIFVFDTAFQYLFHFVKRCGLSGLLHAVGKYRRGVVPAIFHSGPSVCAILPPWDCFFFRDYFFLSRRPGRTATIHRWSGRGRWCPQFCPWWRVSARGFAPGKSHKPRVDLLGMHHRTAWRLA